MIEFKLGSFWYREYERVVRISTEEALSYKGMGILTLSAFGELRRRGLL